MIRGIPMKHNHRQYRSRLEARWAAFFDLLGWRYEYEPFDLNGWIPDFALMGGEKPLLVEIKPVASFPEDVAKEIEQSGWNDEVLIVGFSIDFDNHFNLPDEVTYSPRIGWLWEEMRTGSGLKKKGWNPATICTNFDKSQFGIHGDGVSWHSRLHTEFYEDGDRRCGTPVFWCASDHIGSNVLFEELKRLWAEAGNAVQWRAPR